MRCRLFLSLLLLSALHAQAATLKGVILANEIGGPPVPNVQVTAVAGANPTVSNSDGTFALLFSSKQPGEIVQIILRKQGFVVVNDIQLRLPLPKDTDAEPLILLLSKGGDREEMARRFYRLRSFEAIEQTYQNRLKELETKNQATTASLEALRKERDQAKAAAEKLGEELARANPEISDLNRDAMSLFLGGKPEEAVKILDDEKLRRYAEAGHKLIEEAVSGYLLKARILTTLFRFDEAEKTYQAAIDVAPDSREAQFAFAAFSEGLNRFPEALAAYTRALDLARRDGAQADVASTLNNRGNVHRDQNRMDEAMKDYDDALKAFRELSRENPENYLPKVVATLNNLGLLHGDQNHMEQASKNYTEALTILHELDQKNHDFYLPYMALTLNNLGGLRRDQHRTDEAIKAFEDALKMYRELAKRNPETYLPDVAMTLNNLGFLHDLDKGIKESEDALKIYRELAKRNPETYLPDVAMTLSNLGPLHSEQKRMDEAGKDYKEALAIDRDLALKNPDTYLPEVARALYGMSILYVLQNRIVEARQVVKESLDIYVKFAERNPDQYNRYVESDKELLSVLAGIASPPDENRPDALPPPDS